MISVPFNVVVHVGISATLIHLSQGQNLQYRPWQSIQYTSTTAIPTRNSHGGAFLSSTNEYLVYGGWNGASMSDFHSIDMNSMQSTQLSASTPLRGRHAIASTSDSVSNFYVHGGYSGAGMLFTFNIMIQV
jgi:hypothetical protein